MTTYYVAGIPYSATLSHHGIKGQKWGIRRYQNEDGTLTPAGLERYYGNGSQRHIQKELNRADKEAAYIIGDINKHSYAESGLRKKAQKMVQKNTDENGVVRLDKRKTAKLLKIKKTAETHLDEIEKAKRLLEEIESEQWKLMGAAADQGYSILSTPKYRSTVRAGERAVNYLVYGGILGSLMEVLTYGPNGYVTKGNSFKVK